MKSIGYSTDSKVACISKVYVKIKNISRAEAMSTFLVSATYQALVDEETRLCLEVFKPVCNSFLEVQVPIPAA